MALGNKISQESWRQTATELWEKEPEGLPFSIKAQKLFTEPLSYRRHVLGARATRYLSIIQEEVMEFRMGYRLRR